MKKREVCEEGGLEDVCFTAMAKVALAYQRIWPEKGLDDYRERIMFLVGERDDPSITVPDEIASQFFSEQELESEVVALACKTIQPLYILPTGRRGMVTRVSLTENELQSHAEFVASRLIKPIYISTAYCGRALRAFWNGQEPLAWGLASEGMYWCGVADAFSDIEQVIENSKLILRQKARIEEAFLRGLRAADKRDELYATSREFAYRLVHEHVSKAGEKWPSINAFLAMHSQEIHEFVYANNPTIKKKSKLESFEITLRKWLDEMPSVENFFATLAFETKRDRAKKLRKPLRTI